MKWYESGSECVPTESPVDTGVSADNGMIQAEVPGAYALDSIWVLDFRTEPGKGGPNEVLGLPAAGEGGVPQFFPAAQVNRCRGRHHPF